jgi:hypothetical protein
MGLFFLFYGVVLKPDEKPDENGPIGAATNAVPCVCPIPCDINAPPQHLTSYVSLSTHKHACLLFFGELKPLVGPM